MTPQKRRKRMDDEEGLEFVFGQTELEPTQIQPAPEPAPEAPKPKRAQKPKSAPVPESVIEVKATPVEPEPAPETAGILDRILAPGEGQERMIRFTADLPESLHRKLTMLAAKSGKKKIELVRAILEEVLKDVKT